MRKMLRALLPVFTIALAAGFVGPEPAVAHTDVCTYIGGMKLNLTGFGDPATHSSRTSPFMFFYAAGLCTINQNPNTSGLLTGWCDLATGTGTTATGHSFSVSWSGETMTFSGQVTGAFTVTEDPLDSRSCAAGNADSFIVRGTFLLSHTALPADVCGGEFRMTLSVPFTSSVTSSNNATFTIQFVAGTCSGPTPINMTGTMTGTCFVATGAGTTNSGYNANIQWYSYLMGFTGQVIGSAFVAEDPNTPTSCALGGETQFLLTGTIARP